MKDAVHVRPADAEEARARRPALRVLREHDDHAVANLGAGGVHDRARELVVQRRHLDHDPLDGAVRRDVEAGVDHVGAVRGEHAREPPVAGAEEASANHRMARSRPRLESPVVSGRRHARHRRHRADRRMQDRDAHGRRGRRLRAALLEHDAAADN